MDDFPWIGRYYENFKLPPEKNQELPSHRFWLSPQQRLHTKIYLFTFLKQLLS